MCVGVRVLQVLVAVDLAKIWKKIPPINQRIIARLVAMVRLITLPENKAHNRMNGENLAIVLYASFMRCPALDPRVMLQDVKPSMHFIRWLFASSIFNKTDSS